MLDGQNSEKEQLIRGRQWSKDIENLTRIMVREIAYMD